MGVRTVEPETTKSLFGGKNTQWIAKAWSTWRFSDSFSKATDDMLGLFKQIGSHARAIHKVQLV